MKTWAALSDDNTTITLTVYRGEGGNTRLAAELPPLVALSLAEQLLQAGLRHLRWTSRRLEDD